MTRADRLTLQLTRLKYCVIQKKLYLCIVKTQFNMI